MTKMSMSRIVDGVFFLSLFVIVMVTFLFFNQKLNEHKYQQAVTTIKVLTPFAGSSCDIELPCKEEGGLSTKVKLDDIVDLVQHNDEAKSLLYQSIKDNVLTPGEALAVLALVITKQRESIKAKLLDDILNF